MGWRPANAIATLKAQVLEAFPTIPRADIGIIGDASHSARTSDHNPNDAGVVCAIDFPDLHGHPFEAALLAEALRASMDPRINYVIHDRKIWHRDVSPYWRPYTGSSPHDEHIHISVQQNPRLYDDGKPFALPWNKEVSVSRFFIIDEPYKDDAQRDAFRDGVYDELGLSSTVARAPHGVVRIHVRDTFVDEAWKELAAHGGHGGIALETTEHSHTDWPDVLTRPRKP